MVQTDKIDMEFLRRLQQEPERQYTVEVRYPIVRQGIKSAMELATLNLGLLDKYARAFKEKGIEYKPVYAGQAIRASLNLMQIIGLLENPEVISITARDSEPICKIPEKWEPSPYL
jgi:hypothetical protein